LFLATLKLFDLIKCISSTMNAIDIVHVYILRYWVEEEIGVSGSYALVIPERNATQSWDTSDRFFQLNFT